LWLCVLAAVVAQGAAPARGQGTGFYIYADYPERLCIFTPVVFGLNSLYIVHADWHDPTATATAVQFKVEYYWPEAIQSGVYFPDNLTLGDIFTGIVVGYAGCKPLPRLVARMDFIPTLAAPLCSRYVRIVPDPAVASGQIEVVDCDAYVQWAWGYTMTFPGSWSECPVCAGPCEWCGGSVPVESSTWGRVKALYQ